LFRQPLHRVGQQRQKWTVLPPLPQIRRNSSSDIQIKKEFIFPTP